MPSLTSDNNVNVQITTKADLEGIDKTKAGMAGVGGAAEESASKGIAWGSNIKSAGLIAGVALAGVVKVGGDLVSSFNDSAQYGAALDAVLRSTGGAAGITKDAAVNLSKELEHTTAIGDEAVMSAENMLLTFTNIGKDVFPTATKAAADMATAMNGGAVPSAEQMRNQAILLGKALQDPDAGLGALHRVGVNVDELKKKFTDSMPIQEKQKLILQELGSEFGGQAASQLNTYAGKQAHLKEQIDDVKESMGEIIVNAMTPLQGAFSKLVPWLEKGATWLANNKVAVIAIAGAVAGLLIGVLAAAVIAIGWIPIAITAAGMVLGAVIAVIISKWQEWKGWIIGIAAIIGAPLIPFIAMAVLIIKYWDDIKNFGMNAINWIVNGVMWLKDNWITAIGFVIGFFATLPFKLPIYVFDAMRAIINFIMSINWGAVFAGIGHAIAGAASGIWNAIYGTFQRLAGLNWGSIISGLAKSVANGIIGLLEGAINGALHGIPGHPHVSLPRFATGVKNFGGGFALVGEEGPEIAYLPPGSDVYPNGTRPNGMGGGGSTKTVTIQNLYVTSAEAAREVFEQLDADSLLLGKGLTAARGAA
jgi:hypothetical protein